jgi:hypothetical protein
MLEIYKAVCLNQFEASFCMFHACVERCSDVAWNRPAANHPVCRAAFHTLFYADFYLGANEPKFREQPFHRAHPELFRDYEELEYRPAVRLYDKPSIRMYLDYCREKARRVISVETEESLAGPSGFARRMGTRAELHVYNMRHVQHHVAQLSLRLRVDENVDIPWVGSGWREV